MHERERAREADKTVNYALCIKNSWIFFFFFLHQILKRSAIHVVPEKRKRSCFNYCSYSLKCTTIRNITLLLIQYITLILMIFWKCSVKPVETELNLIY